MRKSKEGNIYHDLLLFSNRSFGDKSGPPALPDLESEREDENGEECDVEEEVKREEEVQSLCGEIRTDAACSGIEELSLTVQEEQEDEKTIGEDEEEQENQKTTQGIYCNMQCVLKVSFNGYVYRTQHMLRKVA